MSFQPVRNAGHCVGWPVVWVVVGSHHFGQHFISGPISRAGIDVIEHCISSQCVRTACPNTDKKFCENSIVNIPTYGGNIFFITEIFHCTNKVVKVYPY